MGDGPNAQAKSNVPVTHHLSPTLASDALTEVAAPAGAALRAGVTPITGVANAARASTRPVTITRVRADPCPTRHARIGRAADQPINAGMKCARRAAAADICTVVPSIASRRDAGGNQRPGNRCQAANGAPPGLSHRQRTRHPVESLSIHDRVSSSRAGVPCTLRVSAQYRDFFTDAIPGR